MFSETSTTAAGSAIYQIQNGTSKLIGSASERITPAAVII